MVEQSDLMDQIFARAGELAEEDDKDFSDLGDSEQDKYLDKAQKEILGG